VNIHADHGIKFYSRQIAICANCRTAWEPIDAALIWDRTDACASFSAKASGRLSPLLALEIR
jgi:hypothetical protein